MTVHEAKVILLSRLTCMRLEDLSYVDKGCSHNCDECEYNYAQGTRGEYEEALRIALETLESICIEISF